MRHRSSFLSSRALASALALPLLAGAALPARAADTAPTTERLQVAEPYLELRTGPGRGYPVFFVVEKAQSVVVELRRTDWYRVRAEGGQVGWVQRSQLESTLTAAGSAKTFRDLLLDDYLKRRVEFSGGWGRFKGEPMLRLGLQARLADTLGAELTVGQVQGLFSGTDFWHVSLVSEPWSDRRFSPYFAVGLGQFRNIPNSSLVDATITDAKLAHASLGVRWHLSERFTARLDWTLYTAFVADTRSTEYRSVTAGLGFYF
jgi:uncharacterized protein YgiM (DUF1202 family)